MPMQRKDGTAAGAIPSPVDDRTYNILQALTSTLEAMDAYEVYAAEDDQDGLFTALLTTQRQSADRLLSALREALGAPTRGR